MMRMMTPSFADARCVNGVDADEYYFAQMYVINVRDEGVSTSAPRPASSGHRAWSLERPREHITRLLSSR